MLILKLFRDQWFSVDKSSKSHKAGMENFPSGIQSGSFIKVHTVPHIRPSDSYNCCGSACLLSVLGYLQSFQRTQMAILASLVPNKTKLVLINYNWFELLVKSQVILAGFKCCCHFQNSNRTEFCKTRPQKKCP